MARISQSALKIVTLPNLVYAKSSRPREKWAFTNGTYGLLHPGHVVFLEQSAALGDVLVVAVNSDASYERVKARQVPIPFRDRAKMIAALACVDYVVEMVDDTPHALLRALTPNVLVKSDSSPFPVGHEIVTGYGGQVVVLPAYGGYSTTKLLGK